MRYKFKEYYTDPNCYTVLKEYGKMLILAGGIAFAGRYFVGTTNHFGVWSLICATTVLGSWHTQTWGSESPHEKLNKAVAKFFGILTLVFGILALKP